MITKCRGPEWVSLWMVWLQWPGLIYPNRSLKHLINECKPYLDECAWVSVLINFAVLQWTKWLNSTKKVLIYTLIYIRYVFNAPVEFDCKSKLKTLKREKRKKGF